MGLIAFAFVPLMVQIGVLASNLFSILTPLHQEGLVLALGFSAVSLLVFLFGLLSVLSVNYFSRDVEFLLSLPVRPSGIVAAKFITTLAYEYLAEALFLVPLFAAYGLHHPVHPAAVATAVLIFFALPVIPVAMATVVITAVMPFADIARNRDRFGKIVGTLFLIALLALNFKLQRSMSSAGDAQRIANLLSDGGGIWTILVLRLFPACRFTVVSVMKAGSAPGTASLLCFLAASAASVAVAMAIGERLYFRGVLGKMGRLSSSAAHGLSGPLRKLTARSAFRTYLLKDLRILFRDPVFFLNCILMNFLWPVFLLFATTLGSSGGLGHAAEFLNLIAGSGTFPALVFGFAAVLTSLNGIASSAVSREGKGLALAKALPMAYGRQLLAKAAVSMVMGGVGCLLMVPVALFAFRLPLSFLPAFFILSPLGVAFAAMTGVLIDLHFPKLNWDNAYKAVKQNVNVPIHMALCAFVAGFVYWAANREEGAAGETFLWIAAVFAAMDAGLVAWIMREGQEAFGRIEV
jgi:ABC-2 type transport system permease protein